MHEILRQFIGKTIRIYTISAVESYLDVLEEVHDDYIILKGFFKGDRTYLATRYIESFKEEIKKD